MPPFPPFGYAPDSWDDAKDLYTCFVDLGKVYGRVLCEKLWGCYGSTALMGASCWPSSNCIPDQKIVSVSEGQITTVQLWCEIPTIVHSGTTPLSISEPSTQRLAGQIRPVKPFHALDRFSAACDQAGMKNSAKKIEVLCLAQGSVSWEDAQGSVSCK